MSATQQAAVAVTVGLSALDGYDVLAATLAAPWIVAEWGISHAALGFMLSMGLVGMAIGSLFLAPLADIFGRRCLILVSLALLVVGMGLSGLATSVTALSLWRVVTGLGIGAMIAVINPLATEFANERRRDLAVSMMAIGYPIGGVVGGVAATFLLQHFSWQVLFYIGALLGILMIPMVLKWLPEPFSFLIERPDSRSLARTNQLLERCGFAPLERLPAPRSAPVRAPIGEILGRGNLAITLRVLMINLLYIIGVYFMLSWLPQLVADLGFTPAQAASVSLSVSTIGIVGGLSFGWLVGRFGAKRLTIFILVGYALAMIAFSRAPADLSLLRVLGAVLGFFMIGGACAMHVVVSRSFSDRTRATGAGFVLGIGRVGSAITPAVTGVLFSMGFGRISVSLVLAIGVLGAAFLLVWHRWSPPPTVVPASTH